MRLRRTYPHPFWCCNIFSLQTPLTPQTSTFFCLSEECCLCLHCIPVSSIIAAGLKSKRQTEMFMPLVDRQEAFYHALQQYIEAPLRLLCLALFFTGWEQFQSKTVLGHRAWGSLLLKSFLKPKLAFSRRKVFPYSIWCVNQNFTGCARKCIYIWLAKKMRMWLQLMANQLQNIVWLSIWTEVPNFLK